MQLGLMMEQELVLLAPLRLPGLGLRVLGGAQRSCLAPETRAAALYELVPRLKQEW